VNDRFYEVMLRRAIGGGLKAAALVDRDGSTIALAGELSEEEALSLVALVMLRMKSDDLNDRLFAGQVISVAFDERQVAVAVARRQLFVVTVLRDDSELDLDQVRDLRARVASSLDSNDVGGPVVIWNPGGTGSGGAAEIPLMEYGITSGRPYAKA